VPNPPASGDYFGQATTPVGDWDGDGNSDLVIASPLADDGGRNKGAIELCFLNSDGTIREQRRISSTSGGFGTGLDVRDSFGGRGVSLLGDVDGDGLTDAAVGAYLDDDGGTEAGAIWILFLNADFTVKSKTKISATSGNLSYAPLAGDNFGHSIAAVGDWDGNGVPDIATGANADDTGGTDAGSFSLLLLNSDATVKYQFVINATNNAFPGITIPASDRFSRTVAYMGDHRQNGTRSIAIGGGAHTTGHVWILHFEDFALWVDGLVSGQNGSMRVASAQANAQVSFAWSAKGGGPTSSQWGTLELTAPYFFAGSVNANQNGVAELNAAVPPGLAGTQIWFQAGELVAGNLQLTNGVSTTIN